MAPNKSSRKLLIMLTTVSGALFLGAVDHVTVEVDTPAVAGLGVALFPLIESLLVTPNIPHTCHSEGKGINKDYRKLE